MQYMRTNKQKQLLKNSNLIKSKLRKRHRTMLYYEMLRIFSLLHWLMCCILNIFRYCCCWNILICSVSLSFLLCAHHSHTVTMCARLKNINLKQMRLNFARFHICESTLRLQSEPGLLLSKGFEIVCQPFGNDCVAFRKTDKFDFIWIQLHVWYAPWMRMDLCVCVRALMWKWKLSCIR